MPEQNTAGFVKLRRGFEQHLASISGDALKVYLKLHFLAIWRPGPLRGTVQVTLGQLADELSMNRRMVVRRIAELKSGGYVEVVARGNQSNAPRFRILKFDPDPQYAHATGGTSDEMPMPLVAQAKTALMPETASAHATGGTSAVCSGTGTPENYNTDNKLGGLKKLKEEKQVKVKKEAKNMTLTLAGAIWKKLGITFLPEACSDFVAITEELKPEPCETIARWGDRIITACKVRHIVYPKIFLKKLGEAKRCGNERPIITAPPGTTAREIVLGRRVRDGIASDQEKIELKRVRELLGNC